MDREIYFGGWVDNIHDYIESANVYISSSINEGFGNAFSSALILGVPSVGTKISASKEVVDLLKRGSLVEISEIGLAGGVKQALNKDRLPQLQEKDCPQLSGDYSLEMYIKELS